MKARDTLGLGELVLIFVRVGALGFGGGGAMLAILHSELCTRRSVLTDEEFQVLFGLSRMVPGMNLLALTVLLGHQTHGLPGSLLALTGLTVPSLGLIVLGCVLLRGRHPSPYLDGAVRALTPLAAALMLHTTWQLCGASLRRQRPLARGLWILVAAVAAGLTVGRVVHPAWAVVGGAGVGALLARRLAEPGP